MRLGLAACVLTAALTVAGPVAAENRIFIIANNADGYGVDRCLASGESCGAPMASAYCKARDFAKAVSFRKVDRDEITGAVPSGNSGCLGGSCEQFVAIECSR
jgi:hypothetical protein